jgi:PAS domain S-box-containing protein
MDSLDPSPAATPPAASSGQNEQDHALQAIFDNVSVALFLIDEHRRCLYLNPAAARLTGHLAEGARGKLLHELIHQRRPDGNACVPEECLFHQALAGRRRQQGEEFFLHKSGDFYPAEYAVAPLDEANPASHVLVELREVVRLRPPPPERRHRGSAKTAGAVLEPPGTILVTGGDTQICEHLRLLLQDRYAVRVASNESAALQSVIESPPDVVLAVGPPSESKGGSLLEQLRLDSRTSRTPVILISLGEIEDSRIRAMRAGPDDSLSYPFADDELLARVSTHLDLARMRRALSDDTDDLIHQLEIERQRLQAAVEREQDVRQTAQLLNQLGQLLLGERDPQRLTQRITDLATQLTTAEFGAFFHNVLNERGESYLLYTLSGVPREAFERFPMPRNTAVFAPTFRGEATVRSPDITKDPRYGKNDPYYGMPKGHLPVRSYLAVPVVSRSGAVQGGLFFGHSAPDVFTEQHEARAIGIAATAAVALDNARLFSAAEQSEERYRFLAESIPHMVWTASPDGAIDYVNRQAGDYFGVPGEALIGSGWMNGVHPDDREQAAARWTQSLASGETFEAGFRLRRGSDGSYRWHLARGHAMRAGDGSIVKWFGTCTDFDDQKRIETELRLANQDLEQFAYSASHDLQEPLRQVATFSQLLQRRYSHSLGDQANEFIRYIVEGALRMEALVHDLLAYTQAASLRDGHEGKVDVNDVLVRVQSNLRMAIDENRATIEYEALPAVSVPGVQLLQLFQNLVGNSIKYRSDDPPRIRISAEPRGGMYLFVLEDNGIGIEPQYAKLIFGLFKRLHGGSRYAGTGIGLAICQKIVEHYGGEIWVESELGAGARFFFSLPA